MRRGCGRCTGSTSPACPLPRLGRAVLRGEFGHSRLFAVPAAQVLWPALGSTLVLLGWSLLLAAGIGVLLGAWGAARRGAAPAVDGVAILAQSTPTFWLGILLVILFAVELGWLPAGGSGGSGRGCWRRRASWCCRSPRFRSSTSPPMRGIAWRRCRRSSAPTTSAPPGMKGLSERAMLLAPRLPQCGDPRGHRAGAGCRRAGLGALVTETIFARPAWAS